MKKIIIAALAATIATTSFLAPAKAMAAEKKVTYATNMSYVTSTTYPTLRLGSTGTYVATLQSMLYDIGYRTIGAADGIFGPNTDRVVRAFQSNNHLSVDGIVGPLTWAKLNQIYGEKFGQ